MKSNFIVDFKALCIEQRERKTDGMCVMMSSCLKNQCFFLSRNQQISQQSSDDLSHAHLSSLDSSGAKSHIHIYLFMQSDQTKKNDKFISLKRALCSPNVITIHHNLFFLIWSKVSEGHQLQRIN